VEAERQGAAAAHEFQGARKQRRRRLRRRLQQAEAASAAAESKAAAGAEALAQAEAEVENQAKAEAAVQALVMAQLRDPEAKLEAARRGAAAVRESQVGEGAAAQALVGERLQQVETALAAAESKASVEAEARAQAEVAVGSQEDVCCEFRGFSPSPSCTVSKAVVENLGVTYARRLAFSTTLVTYGCFTLSVICYGYLYAFPQVVTKVDLGALAAVALIIGAFVHALAGKRLQQVEAALAAAESEASAEAEARAQAEAAVGSQAKAEAAAQALAAAQLRSPASTERPPGSTETQIDVETKRTGILGIEVAELEHDIKGTREALAADRKCFEELQLRCGWAPFLQTQTEVEAKRIGNLGIEVAECKHEAKGTREVRVATLVPVLTYFMFNTLFYVAITEAKLAFCTVACELQIVVVAALSFMVFGRRRQPPQVAACIGGVPGALLMYSGDSGTGPTVPSYPICVSSGCHCAWACGPPAPQTCATQRCRGCRRCWLPCGMKESPCASRTWRPGELSSRHCRPLSRSAWHVGCPFRARPCMRWSASAPCGSRWPSSSTAGSVRQQGEAAAAAGSAGFEHPSVREKVAVRASEFFGRAAGQLAAAG